MAQTYQDTNVNQLVINKMTKQEYDNLSQVSETELYLVEEQVDSVVTQNSTNPVQSRAVYDALQNAQGKTYTLSANNEKVVLTPSSGIPNEVSLNTLINGLDTGSSDPQDDDYIIAQYAGGGTTTTTYHRRPLSKFWNWIKSKLGIGTNDGTFLRKDGTWVIPTIYLGTVTSNSLIAFIKNKILEGYKVGYFYANGRNQSGCPDTINVWIIQYECDTNVSNSIQLMAWLNGSAWAICRGYAWNNSNNEPSWKNVALAEDYVVKTGDTMSGLLTLPSLLVSGGRVYGAGDDEGIVITPVSNGFAGLTLGDPSNRHSTFYMNSQKAFWRYKDTTTHYDIEHPSKSGVIALTSDINDLRNKYYSIQEGILPNAIFTAYSDGSKIIFSKGNLIVSSNNDKYFRFAENQYSPIRSNSGNISQTGDRDLIANGCWGGGNINIDPMGVSTNDSDYSSMFGTDIFLGNDFWNPFSKYEIDYILFSRTGTYVFCKARVNSFNGIILFPDAFTNYGGISFTGLNSMSTSYSSNVITKYQFAVLESQGCVFLPCGGTRLGTTVDTTKNEYYTWTLTDSEVSAIYCLNLDGTNQLTTIVQRNTFATGRCVRLVHKLKQNH